MKLWSGLDCGVDRGSTRGTAPLVLPALWVQSGPSRPMAPSFSSKAKSITSSHLSEKKMWWLAFYRDQSLPCSFKDTWDNSRVHSDNLGWSLDFRIHNLISSPWSHLSHMEHSLRPIFLQSHFSASSLLSMFSLYSNHIAAMFILNLNRIIFFRILIYI